MKPAMKTIELELTRTIPASPVEVFDGWLDPKCPGTPWSVADKLVLDPKVDGLYYWLFINEGWRTKAPLRAVYNPRSSVQGAVHLDGVPYARSRIGCNRHLSKEGR